MRGIKIFVQLTLGLTVLVIAVPIVARADTIYTYAFTGYLVYSDFTGIPDGSGITGTYTFDVTSPNAHLTGTLGSPSSQWNLEDGYNASSVIFTTTAQVGSFSYSTLSPANGLAVSYIGGTQVAGYEEFQAGEQNGGTTAQSDFGITACYNGCGGTLPLGDPAYLSNGLPVSFSETSENYLSLYASGTIVTAGAEDVSYRVTSLELVGESSPVPLPAAGWQFACCLAILAALARTKPQIEQLPRAQ